MKTEAAVLVSVLWMTSIYHRDGVTQGLLQGAAVLEVHVLIEVEFDPPRG